PNAHTRLSQGLCCVTHTRVPDRSTCRPQPRPTLFPYTTLFRSGEVDQVRRRASRRELGQGVFHQEARLGCGGIRPGPTRGARREDRKRTRLNSSHLGTSYAVFCLINESIQRNYPVLAYRLIVDT